MRRVLLALLAFGVIGLGSDFGSSCWADFLPPVDEVLQHLIRRSQTEGALETQISYLCTKQTLTEEMDSEGRVTERKIKVGETDSRTSGANDANKWGSQNGISLNDQLLRRYSFTILKRDQLNGRPALLMQFIPKDPRAPVRHIQDRLLNRATGTIWVDAEDYELVKANISLGEPVSFGILGAVDTINFAFERERAESGNWLMHWTETFVKARKFLKPIQTRKRVDWRDFKKLEETSDLPGDLRTARD